MVSILLKLVDLVERQWRTTRQPNAQLAKAMMSLYNALLMCHESYRRFRREPDDRTLRQWGDSLDSLVRTLSTLRNPLAIFSPEVYAQLDQYLNSERRLYSDYRPEHKAEIAFGELQLVIGGDRMTSTPPGYSDSEQDIDEEDFRRVIDRLGGFIRDNVKMEDLFGAVS